jgi:hypothetical protein
MRRRLVQGVVATAALSAVVTAALLAVLGPQQVALARAARPARLPGTASTQQLSHLNGWQGADGESQPSVLCDATGIENCEPVKSFDVKKLYKDSPEVSGSGAEHAPSLRCRASTVPQVAVPSLRRGGDC